MRGAQPIHLYPLLEAYKVKFWMPASSIVSQSMALSYGAEIKSELAVGVMKGCGRSGFEPWTANDMPSRPKYAHRYSKLLGNLVSLHLKAYSFRTSEMPWDRVSI